MVEHANINLYNNIKMFLAKVESIDENYLITFKIPGILEDIEKYPKAYPSSAQHIQQVKVEDSVLIMQPDASQSFYLYSTIYLDNYTGLYFGNVKVDISDGKKLVITTDVKSEERGEDFVPEMKTPNITIDGENKTININDGAGINIDVSQDDDKVTISTQGGALLEIDGKSNKVKFGTSQYTINKFIKDLDTALQSLQTKGSPAVQTAADWYAASVKPFMTIAQQAFPDQ